MKKHIRGKKINKTFEKEKRKTTQSRKSYYYLFIIKRTLRYYPTLETRYILNCIHKL